MSKTKIKEISLEECLKNLSKEELNKLYKETDEDLKSTKKKTTEKDKIEAVTSQIVSNFMIQSFTFNDKEEKQLDDLVNEKDAKTICPKILNNNFVFKFNNQYIVPNEIKQMHNYNLKSGLQYQKKIMLMQFYLLVNGVLEITKLIELAKETGITLTKTELTNLAKENNHIINKNLIYLDPFAEEIDKIIQLHKLKKDKAYKVFPFEKVIAIQINLEEENYEEKISVILSKKVKNKAHLTKLTNYIKYMSIVGYSYEEQIKALLKSEKISLNEFEKEKILDIADEINWCYPSWELNGYCRAELPENDDLNDGAFENLSPTEQLEVYINVYLAINGIMEIDKLLEIITTNHKFNINRIELIQIASKIEDTKILGDYICIKGTEEIIEYIMPIKNMLKYYKIIEDIDEIVKELLNITDNIIELGFEYALSKEEVASIEQLMHMAKIDEDILKSILEESNHKLSSKNQKELLKALKTIQKNARIWKLNGFKESELINLKNK